MSRRLGLLVSLLALAIAGTVSDASLAATTPGWVAPESISEPGQVATVKPAIDDRGRAIALWQEHGIQLSTHAPGGDWTVPTQISSDNSTSQLAFAMNGAGEAVIAWIGEEAEPVLRVVTRAADGSLSPELDLAAPGESPYLPSVAINKSGAAVVAWLNVGLELSVQASTRPPGGDFSSPTVFGSAGVEPREAAVAIDGAGAVTLVWTAQRLDAVVLERSTRAAAASSFSSPEIVSEDGAASASWPAVATNDAGDTVILWRDDTDGGLGIHAISRLAGGAFSAPVPISPDGENVATPCLAIDAAGEATIVWSRFGDPTTVQTSTWNRIAGFSTPVTLSGPGGGFGPSIVGNPSGDTLVVWMSEGGGASVPSGSWKSAGGEFSAPVTLGLPGLDSTPTAAIAADGNGLAVWPYFPGASPARAKGAASPGAPITRSPSPDRVVTVAGFDATAPTLTALGVPSTGTVGEPVSFTAAATDVWDRAPLPTFEFGEGGTGSGGSVSHTYGQPGTYVVKAFATNSVGSTSALATRSITIAAAPGKQGAVKAPAARVRIALRGARQLPIAGGAVELKIENIGDRPVRGALNLWTTAHLGVPLPASVGKQGYRLAVGRSATVRVELGQRALRLIESKRVHRLAVQVNASFRDAHGRGGTVERRVKLRG